jgi:hypothetical protein
MRHLKSLLAGVVAAPLVWLLIAAGQTQWQGTVAEWNAAGRFDTADLIVPGVFLAVAGIVLGLLATLRVSPVGPLVAGLLLLIPTVGMFIHPFNAAEMISDEDGWVLLDQAIRPRLPVANGTLLMLSALLLIAIFSASRWRRLPAVAAAPVAVDTDVPPTPGPAPVVVDDRPAEPEPDEEPPLERDLAREREETTAPVTAEDTDLATPSRHATNPDAADLDAAEPDAADPDAPDPDAPDPDAEDLERARRDPDRQESPWSAPPGGTTP